MRYGIFLGIGIIVSLLFLALKFFGYNYIELAVLSVIFSLVVIELSRRNDKKLFTNELRHALTSKVDNIERICNEIAIGLEKERETVKGELRIEIKDSVDMVAAKAIQIENRIGELKKNLISVAQGFDTRIGLIENKFENSKDETQPENL